LLPARPLREPIAELAPKVLVATMTFSIRSGIILVCASTPYSVSNLSIPAAGTVLALFVMSCQHSACSDVITFSPLCGSVLSYKKNHFHLISLIFVPTFFSNS
jgi:hypothetical protein